MKKQAKEWMEFAKTDLQTTMAIVTEENLSTIAAFHVQQCIEKSLKALLALNNKNIPRTHDLIKLIQIIEEEKIRIDMKINEEILDQINQVYIDTRYPADFGLLPGSTIGIPMVLPFVSPRHLLSASLPLYWKKLLARNTMLLGGSLRRPR